MKIAVYPGSFDPITNGHLDIINRSCAIFDKVIVLVANNPDKKSRFTIEERLELIKRATAHLNNVEVDYTSGLTVKYAKEKGAKTLIRGLRAVSDFEYEFQLSSANQIADRDIDMVFFMAHGDTTFVSSSSIISLYKNGVDVSNLVPSCVIEKLEEKSKSHINLK